MSGWYFSQLEPSRTLLAVEPNGLEHVVKGCNLHSVEGERLFQAMVRDLTKDKAPRHKSTGAWKPQLPPTTRQITLRGGGYSSTHFAYTAADVEGLMTQAYEEGRDASNEMLKATLDEWIEKTNWVQKSHNVRELGIHRADVLRERIEALEAQLAMSPKQTSGTSEPVGEVQTYTGSILDGVSAPFNRVVWKDGIQPPPGTKLYAAPVAQAERVHPYGRCSITGPAEDVAFIFRHLPDVGDTHSEPVIRYDELYDYALANRLSYNELCALVRSAVIAAPAQAAEPVAFVPADDLAQFMTYGGAILANDHQRDDTDVPLYAAPVAQAEPAWLPIETAPKDGSTIMLLEDGNDEPFFGFWWEGRARWRASTIHYDTDGDACVIDRIYSEGVSHWMPLPQPPKEQP